MRHVILLLAACGGSSHVASPDGMPDGTGSADATVDQGWGTCGSEVVPPNEFSRGGALAIGLDGAAYLSTFDAGQTWIARRVPGTAIDGTWLGFGAAASIADIAVAPGGRIYYVTDQALAYLDPVATPTPTTLGPPIASATSLAVDSLGRLYVGRFGGIERVDLATGARTAVTTGDMVSQLVSADATHLVVATYSGIDELVLDASGAVQSRTTLYPFTTRALQRIGIDQLGRWYATVNEMSEEKILRFAHDFTGEETLLMRAASGTSDFRDLAFGKGALACNIYVSGFNSDRHADGTTPGRP